MPLDENLDPAELMPENVAIQNIKEYLVSMDGMTLCMALSILEMVKLDLYTESKEIFNRQQP